MTDNNQGKIHQLTDSVRRYLGRDTGPSRTVRAGERAPVISMTDRTRVGNAAFLKTIWAKIEGDRPISRDEWSTLLELVREAYVDTRRTQHSVVVGPLMAVLGGFRAFLRLRNTTYPGQSFSTDHYYVSQLSPLVDGLEQDSRSGAWKHDPIDVVGSIISDLGSQTVFKGDAAYLAQLFLGALTEEPAVDSARLSQALVPYALAVFRLAARGCALRDESRRNWAQTVFLQEHPDRFDTMSPCLHPQAFVAGELHLEVYPETRDMTGVLSMHADHLRIAFDFVKLEHWADVLLSAVESRSLIVSNRGFVLQEGAFQVDFFGDRVVELRQLLRHYAESQELQQDRERMMNYWGQV